MDDAPRDPKAGDLSPRTTRAVAIFTLRVKELFPGCPDGTARDAALRWSLTCAPRLQEREARITHDETIRNAAIEHVRWTMTDWPALVAAGAANPLTKKRITLRIREVLEGWKGQGSA